MKHKVLYILLIVLLNSSTHPVLASFFVKKHIEVPSIAGEIKSVSVVGKPAAITKGSENTNDLTPPPFRSFAARGWVGILAFLLGIAGFIAPIFAVGAVLFGFLGIGGRKYGRHGYGYYGDGTDEFLRVHNRQNGKKGLAIAGLVLGITVIVLSIFFGFTGWGLY